MSKRIYISADYSSNDGDREVIDVLHNWGNDSLHKVDYVDTAQVVSGSISMDPDCRSCDLKEEFNRQINASSTVIFIIGDKTASRTAGSFCKRNTEGFLCSCTPYKQNANGQKTCKRFYISPSNEDIGSINTYSYLEHEFRQALQKDKTIIIVYNSLIRQPSWLPSYMSYYEDRAQPFWVRSGWNDRIGNYNFIKNSLGYN